MDRRIAFFLIVFISLFSAHLFGYSYKIDSVKYEIIGQTKESSIKRNISIDTNKVFENEEAFLIYVDEIKQKFGNTRLFEEIEIDYSIKQNESSLDSSEDNPCIEDETLSTAITIKLKDSFHFLAVPYFKFSTSNGLSAKIKMKDMNFLGTMNTLTSSLDFNWKPDENGKQFKIFEPEFNFEYDLPFKIGSQDFTWINDYSISYTWGENTPEWKMKTGIAWSKEIGITTLNLSFTQGFYRNLDYRKYKDDTYFSETFNASLPMNIFEIPHYDFIKLTPYAYLNFNFDPIISNGYSGFAYSDLKGPVIETGTTFSFENINWTSNFRDGLSLSLTPFISYNFASIQNDDVTKFNIGVNTSAYAYKSFDYIGLNSSFYGFVHITNAEKRIGGAESIDSYLRGIVDNRRSNYNSEYYQTQTPTALVFNFDMPIHIFTTDWENFVITRKIGFMRYFNFELQMSPFIDLALIQTTKEYHGYDRTFNLKDGLYTAGFEFLVFPQKWKSFTVRVSAGYDIGTLLFGSVIETSWRNKLDANKSWYKTAELSIGLGLHY